MNSDKTKILIYELNEVPRRLLEFYIEKNPNSAFSIFKKEGLVLDTYTKDDGDLHPWSTWPTVHRGVYNFDHQIRFINQDLTKTKKYKPVWEILSEQNINTGIFGSLQSYPPINNKNISFYLPDTFAPDEKAIPQKLSQFQSFNLSMVGKNKAVSRAISNSQINLLLTLIKKRIVEKDEREKNLRKVLNFGHTFAHAYEGTLNFSKKLNHGEAVILGMQTALKFSMMDKLLKLKEYKLIKNHISSSKLPMNLKNKFSIKDLNKILSFMSVDKKNQSKKVNLILLKKIGSPIINREFGINKLRIFLKNELSH